MGYELLMINRMQGRQAPRARAKRAFGDPFKSAPTNYYDNSNNNDDNDNNNDNDNN